MDFRRQALIIIVALSSVLGCRHDQAAKRELLERELRLQEDRIYALEDALEDAQHELDRARGIVRDGSPPGPRPGLGSLFGGGNSGGSTFAPPTYNDGTPLGVDPRPAAPSGVNPGSSSGSGNAPPSVILPPKGDTAPPTIELPGGTSAPPFRGAPVISPPDPKKPEGLPAPGGPAPPFKPGGAQYGTPSEGSTARRDPILKEMSSPKFRTPGAPSTDAGSDVGEVLPAPNHADRQVKSVTLNRRTGGWNSDGKPGDEGVIVIVEPRNARGEVVPTPGAVTVVLIDPALEGDAGRYAKWEFTAEAAGALHRSIASGGSGGLHFELAWPESPPTNAKLALFVRYTADDGQQLQVRKDLFVDLGAGVSSAWRNPSAPPANVSQPIFTAVRAAGDATTNRVVPTNGEAGAAPSTPLHWGRPKPLAAAASPEMLAPPSNAQPLTPSNPGAMQGPALFAPR